MHPHSYLKAFCPLPLDFHSRCRPRVHCFYQPYHSPLHSQPSQRPPQNLSRHSIKRFLQKAIHNSLRFCRYFSCTGLTTNTASVVPLPGINPKCMSSMQILPSIIFLLSLASTTLSNTFSPC